jgi:hypothetical protein
MRGVWWRGTSSITNNLRLNSAIGFITPKDMLAGRQQEIHTERARKLEAARKQRQFVASRRREKAKTLVSGRFRGTGRGGLLPDARRSTPNPVTHIGVWALCVNLVITNGSFSSLQFRVFGLAFVQDRDIRVGILPEREKILVGGFCFSLIS